MYNAVEFDEPNKAETAGSKSPDATGKGAGSTEAAARSMQDITAERLKGQTSDGGEKLDKKITVTGATVETDKNGLVRSVARPDGSAIQDAVYSNDVNKKIESFVAKRIDQSKVVYKCDKDGKTFSPFSVDGKPLPNEPVVSKVELNTNGNISFLDANGNKVIVRGNGTIIPAGEGKFDVQFDAEGRAKIIANADKIRTYSYKGTSKDPIEYKEESPKLPGVVYAHTFNEETKKWECKNQDGAPFSTPQGRRRLSEDLVFAYEDKMKLGDKEKTGLRLSGPNGVEVFQHVPEQQEGAPKAPDNADIVVLTHNEQGQFIGVQTFAPRLDSQGKALRDPAGNRLLGVPGKQYTAGFKDGKSRILEADPLTGTAIAWDKPGSEDKWTGQVIFAAANSPLKSGQLLQPRLDLDIKENGLVTYTDEQNAKHMEFNRQSKIEFPDGHVVLTDRGNIVECKDDKYKFEYIWKDDKNGKPVLEKAYSVVNGKKEDLWTPSPGNIALPQPDGRFSCKVGDNIVVLDLDFTATTYQIGKDEGGPTLTPIEIELTTGAKRTITPGADIEHPKMIVDTFTDAKGRNMRRTIEALPVVTPNRQMAAHNQRLQEYKLTEEILATIKAVQLGQVSKVIHPLTVSNLEIFKNGDLRFTAANDPTNPFQPFEGMRFELKAKSMAESITPPANANVPAPKSITPVATDIRLADAKQRLEKVFAKDISSRLPAKADGTARSMDDYLSEYLLLPRIEAAPDGQLNAEQKNITAYKYELAYALVDQQKLDSAERKRQAGQAK